MARLRTYIRANKIDADCITLFESEVSRITNEVEAIWLRYSAFLILNGFAVTAVISFITSEEGNLPLDKFSLFIMISTLLWGSILINFAWNIINFSGWQNQNLHLHYASRILPKFIAERMSYAKYRRELRKPRGYIYIISQSIPCFAIVFAFFTILYLLNSLYNYILFIRYLTLNVAAMINLCAITHSIKSTIHNNALGYASTYVRA